jgi:photosystem II stability/assembly factor-like uncharacterized protein
VPQHLARAVVGCAFGAALVVQATPANASVVHDAPPALATAFQGYGPTGLVDVTCPTALVCLAAGDERGPEWAQYSMLYRSTDGGATWTPIAEPGGSLDVNYVYAIASVAISCGSPTFCVVEYTTTDDDEPLDYFDVSHDGGRTWASGGSIAQVGPTLDTGLVDLTCTGISTCVGILAGKVLSTTDGGASWSTRNEPSNVRGLSCPSPTLCYVLQTAAVHRRSTLVVSSTRDLGQTLVPRLRVSGSGWNAPPMLACSSALVCKVVTSGADDRLRATTDGGRRWLTRWAPQGANQRARALQCTSALDCTELATDPTSLSMIESYSTTTDGAAWQRADAVGRLGYPGAVPGLGCSRSTTTCLATLGTRSVFRNPGVGRWNATWSASPIGSGTPTLTAIGCDQGGACLAVGDGLEATSVDDGHTWSSTSDPALAGDSFSSLTCPLPSTCVAAGESGSGSGLVLLTSDLGLHWTAANAPWEVSSVRDVECATAEVCLALPGFSSVLHNVPTIVLRSTDGGDDWSLIQVAPASAGFTLSAIQCPTTTRCIAVGHQPGSPLVEVSDDAGVTWATVSAAALSAAGNVALEGVGCTSSLDCVTSAAVPTSSAANVDAFGTTDSGSNWSNLGQMLSVPYALYGAANPSLTSCTNGTCVAYSVNEVGPERPTYYVSLLASSNGGASWTVYDAPYAVSAVDVAVAADGTVVAVGQNAEGGPLLLVGPT